MAFPFTEVMAKCLPEAIAPLSLLSPIFDVLLKVRVSKNLFSWLEYEDD